MPIDAERVPASARHLIPLAGRWAIGDDYEREAAVDGATDQELRRLVEAVASTGDDFWGWLAGPESFSANPSPEYIALTDLSMAADSARVKLSRRHSG
jgi:hypothetical protein